MTLPVELPYGRKELNNLEAYLFSRVPKDFEPFTSEVGLGCVFYTRRGMTNASATWYWSKVRRAIVKAGLVQATSDVWVLHSRIRETVEEPRLDITFSTEDL